MSFQRDRDLTIVEDRSRYITFNQALPKLIGTRTPTWVSPWVQPMWHTCMHSTTVSEYRGSDYRCSLQCSFHRRPLSTTLGPLGLIPRACASAAEHLRPTGLTSSKLLHQVNHPSCNPSSEMRICCCLLHKRTSPYGSIRPTQRVLGVCASRARHTLQWPMERTIAAC